MDKFKYVLNEIFFEKNVRNYSTSKYIWYGILNIYYFESSHSNAIVKMGTG